MTDYIEDALDRLSSDGARLLRSAGLDALAKPAMELMDEGQGVHLTVPELLNGDCSRYSTPDHTEPELRVNKQGW